MVQISVSGRSGTFVDWMTTKVFVKIIWVLLAHPLQHRVGELGALGVVTLRPIVSSACLAENQFRICGVMQVQRAKVDFFFCTSRPQCSLRIGADDARAHWMRR